MRPSTRSIGCLVLVLPLLAITVGCRGLENGQMTWVQPQSDQPRAGNVYLIRGLIGVFSTGMDDLAVKINQNGVRARVFQDAQHMDLAEQIVKEYKGNNNSEPLVLIGHSYGADDVVRVSRVLHDNGIKVDLAITIDATVPPAVPANVVTCYNYFQSSVTDSIPMFRGIPLEHDAGAQGVLVNIDIRKDRRDLLEADTNHINIDKNPHVHEVVIKEVLEVCPPRPLWVVAHPSQGPQAQQASQVIQPQNTRGAQARNAN